MGSFVSRWVVAQRHQVGDGDVGADGVVRDDIVAAWVAAACEAYLEQCPTLRDAQDRSGAALRARDHDLPAGSKLGPAATVTVSAGVTELFPTEFTMAFRFRTYGSADDVVLNASCTVSLVDPTTGEAQDLGVAVRDELIALEHGARHTN